MARKDELNKLFKNLSKDLSNLLKENNLELIKTEDGRSDSIVNESKIIEYIYAILVKYEHVKVLDKAKIRNWFDFGFDYKNALVPVNLKMTAKFGRDNVSSKKGIIWAFSDISDVKNISSWDDYKNVIDNNISKSFGSEKDYFFLIINKNNIDDIFHTSIKQINCLAPNANNLPFQANWDKNRMLINRNPIEAYKYVFSIWKQSMDKLKNIAAVLDDYEKNI